MILIVYALPGDGARVAEHLRVQRPDVVVFSRSSFPQTYGDVNLSPRSTPEDLLEAILKV